MESDKPVIHFSDDRHRDSGCHACNEEFRFGDKSTDICNYVTCEKCLEIINTKTIYERLA